MKPLHRKRLAQAVAAATAFGGAAMLHAAFEEITGSDNPFSTVTSGGNKPSIVMMDLDNDGDLDLVMFHQQTEDDFPFTDSYTSVWENTGSATAAVFTQLQDAPGYGYAGDSLSSNPFANSYTNFYGHPVTAAELDDGREIFIAGTSSTCCNALLNYAFINRDGEDVVTGLTQTNSNTGTTGYGASETPFYGFSLPAYGAYGSSVAAGDLYNNGRPDLLINDSTSGLRLFENTGKSFYGQYSFSEVTSGPFPISLDGAYYGAPIVLHDIDDDGDLDLIVGTATAGNMRLFLNKGSAATPDFEEVTDEAEELGLDIASRGWAAPTFADVTGDGVAELIVLERFQNTSELLSAGGDSAPRISSTEQEVRLFAFTAAEEEEEESETTTETKKKKGKLFGGLGTGLLASFGLLWLRRRR
ncbi:MAG: hypothetical protein CVV10_01660 [Gammaproteobacteria bacterium HGW-Gammaproteobacteria-14]|nr:MAG: hypothetical protein CVV10_01660 [Gammaproteobacteria bacterium HGW-Gammaproteobacteria-14]